MTDLPELTEADIRRWTGDTSFGRARSYVGEAIFNTRRMGATLKASCQGSLPHPYHISVTMGARGIEAASCSCPVGGGGSCKHVAAMLITWLNDPQLFVEMEDLETALERRSKPELIALIRQMVGRFPDLEQLLELPMPVAGAAHKPLEAETIRRQVNTIFRGAGDEWGVEGSVAQSLEPLVALGDDYGKIGDWRSAATVYQVVAAGVLEHYGMMHDEDGYLGEIVNECVNRLAECLDETKDAAQREALLHALFDIYHWDINAGGIGIGDDVPDLILYHATPDERQRVSAWLRAALPNGDSWSDNYHRTVFGRFLLDLEGESLDDEGFIRVCRETGRVHDLVDRLLALGRLDEAVAEARNASDYDLLTLADRFRSRGHADRATALVRERAKTSADRRIVEWLKNSARERGDLAEALELTQSLFWQHPALPGYEEVKSTAEAAKRWTQLRPVVLARLAQERRYALLTEIHLAEGAVDQALKTLPQATDMIGYGVSPLLIRVAEAAEKQHPRDALRLYGAAVERLIQLQGRDNYATAAQYLLRMRDLYHRLGGDSDWRGLIDRIRTQNTRLRALKEELTKAGL